MFVRILLSEAGLNYAFTAGDEVDLPDAEARRRINLGWAEPINPQEAAPASAPVAARPVSSPVVAPMLSQNSRLARPRGR